MVLVQPSLQLKNAYLDFAQEWDAHNENIVPMSARLGGKTYEDWLAFTLAIQEKEINGLVPSHTLFLCEQDTIIGAVNIRHTLNENLLQCGGHIGYGVRPSQRKKGYAGQMLALALPVAKQLGIHNALVTCDKENIASAKTILKNGGVLENEVINANDGKIIQRYWISL